MLKKHLTLGQERTKKRQSIGLAIRVNKAKHKASHSTSYPYQQELKGRVK
tara:strand:- start:724 stop:873 length:150 start_codon:yes stop_codon:yes gene_type:complete